MQRLWVLACQLALPNNVVVLLKWLLVDPLVQHCLNALLVPHLHKQTTSQLTQVLTRVTHFFSIVWMPFWYLTYTSIHTSQLTQVLTHMTHCSSVVWMPFWYCTYTQKHKPHSSNKPLLVQSTMCIASCVTVSAHSRSQKLRTVPAKYKMLQNQYKPSTSENRLCNSEGSWTMLSFARSQFFHSFIVNVG